MKSRRIVFIVVLIAVAVAVFALYPTIDPITLEYNSIWGDGPDRTSDIFGTGHFYLAHAKSDILRAGDFLFGKPTNPEVTRIGAVLHSIGLAFEDLGRALGTPGGLLTILALLYVITLVVWIYVSWLIGLRKGRPGLGVTLGLLLGFIGLIIMLLLPDNESKTEHDKLDSGEYVKCPHCAELIRSEANVCKHCGRDVAAKA